MEEAGLLGQSSQRGHPLLEAALPMAYRSPDLMQQDGEKKKVHPESRGQPDAGGGHMGSRRFPQFSKDAETLVPAPQL